MRFPAASCIASGHRAIAFGFRGTTAIALPVVSFHKKLGQRRISCARPAHQEPFAGNLSRAVGVRGEVGRWQAILALPNGSLVPKNIKGGLFYYLAYRKGAKVRFDYKGKLSAAEVADFKKAAGQKAQYRRLIVDLRKQIVFLNRALHERKRRSH